VTVLGFSKEVVRRMGASIGGRIPYSIIAFDTVGTDTPRNLAICEVGRW
jgi:hypothetical protein